MTALTLSAWLPPDTRRGDAMGAGGDAAPSSASISTSETSSSAEETSAVVSMSTGIISSRSSATEMPASAAMAGRRRSSKRAFAMVTVKGTDSEFEK